MECYKQCTPVKCGENEAEQCAGAGAWCCAVCCVVVCLSTRCRLSIALSHPQDSTTAVQRQRNTQGHSKSNFVTRHQCLRACEPHGLLLRSTVALSLSLPSPLSRACMRGCRWAPSKRMPRPHIIHTLQQYARKTHRRMVQTRRTSRRIQTEREKTMALKAMAHLRWGAARVSSHQGPPS